MMPELRKEYLTGEWVSIAEERGNRPRHFKKSTVVTEENICPFCPENSHLTPAETYKSPSGLIRAIPNKFPLVMAPKEFLLLNETPYAAGYGYHEVIIDTPLHKERLHEFSAARLFELFQCIQNRLNYFSADPQIQYVQVFKNDGIEAGATIPHSHWQIAALPMLPFRQELSLHNLNAYYEKNGLCYFCDRQQMFPIAENEDWLAYAPYASRFPYEIHLLPKRHVPDFKELTPTECRNLGALLQKLIRALLSLYPELDYNICFQNAPYIRSDENRACTHFHLQIIPRLGNLAGFELSTGCYINSVRPERAAETLIACIAQT